MTTPIEISRYCIPWTPFKKRLEESVVMLVSTAGVYHAKDKPFNVEGDLSFRTITAEAVSELLVADAHYPHDCIDSDINTVFPLDRLYELAHDEHRIGGVTEQHFSTGFSAELRRFREETVPELTNAAVRLRPDCVLLTGG